MRVHDTQGRVSNNKAYNYRKSIIAKIVRVYIHRRHRIQIRSLSQQISGNFLAFSQTVFLSSLLL